MTPSISTAEGIIALRARLGWSQRRLAEELGISVSTVARWEIHQTKPSPNLIRKLNGIEKALQSRSEFAPSKFIQAGQERLQYFEVGQGEKILIMVHGHVTSARVWQLAMGQESLADFRVIAINGRGVGASSRLQGPSAYSIESLSSELFHFVKALGLSNFTLVGHSLGGAVITHFALTHKTLVKSLVLVDPILTDNRPKEIERDQTIRERIRTEKPPFQDMGLQAPHLPYEFVVAIRKELSEVEVGRVIGGLSSIARLNLCGHLGELALPVLVIGGDLDWTVGVDRLLRNYLELGEEFRSLHIFHGVGHVPPIEVPHDFARVVASFIGHCNPDGI